MQLSAAKTINRRFFFLGTVTFMIFVLSTCVSNVYADIAPAGAGAGDPNFSIKDVQINTGGGNDAGSHPPFEVSVEFNTSDGGTYTNGNANTPRDLQINLPKGLLIDTSGVPRKIGNIQVQGRIMWFTPVPIPIWGWRSKTWNGSLYTRDPSLRDMGASTPRQQAPTSFRYWFNKGPYPSFGRDAGFEANVNKNKNGLSLNLFLENQTAFDSEDWVRKLILDRITFKFQSEDGSPSVATLPTRCDTSLKINVKATSHSNITDEKTFDSGITPTNCGTVKLDPTAQATGDEKKTEKVNALQDSYAVNTSLPRTADRARSATAQAQLALPEGMRIGGNLWKKEPCTLAQFNPDDQVTPAKCTDESIIGRGELKIDDLLGSAKGNLYLGGVQQINDQAFGYRGKVFFEVDRNDEALPFRYKLVGDLTINKNTGQVNITFGDHSENAGMIQFPWQGFNLQFNRLFINPNNCVNEARGAVTLTPWADSPTFSGGRNMAASFTLLPVKWGDTGADCPAVRPFNVTLRKATTTSTQAKDQAGAVDLSVIKSDPREDQDIKAVTVKFPAGMKLDLASVKPCSEPDILARRCSADSELSTEIQKGIGDGLDWYGGGFASASTIGSGKLFATNVTPTGADVVATFEPTGKAIQTTPWLIKGRIEAVGPSGKVELQLTDVRPEFDGIPFLLHRFDLKLKNGLLINSDKCDPAAFELEALSHGGATSSSKLDWKATGC